LRLQNYEQLQRELSENTVVKNCWTSEGNELVRAALAEEERARGQMKDVEGIAGEPDVTSG
jgi:hypothetical protein